MRIHVWLAKYTDLSRRTAEKYVIEGRVRINQQVAKVGQQVTNDDLVYLEGTRIYVKAIHHRLLALNKPEGYVCSHKPQGSEVSVDNLLPQLDNGKWIYVGRLDINTSGLLLVTTDGQLANKLAHPSKGFSRKYLARVSSSLSQTQIQLLQKGLMLEDGLAKFDEIKATKRTSPGQNTWYQVTIGEGRNREVRRLFESQGLQVSRLKRIAFGPIILGRNMKLGSYEEIDMDWLKHHLTP